MENLETIASPPAPMPVEPEQVARRIPIRVHAFDPGRVEFSEDTFTCTVGRRGAHIALRNCVVMGDFVRIVNLEDYSEADFKVVGPKHLLLSGISEWVVECVDRHRNIWGLPGAAPVLDEEEDSAALVCRACGAARSRPVSPLEQDVLASTGMIVHRCESCSRYSYWTFADAQHRPAAYPPFEEVAPPPRDVREESAPTYVNTRKHRRLPLRMPILIRRQDGTEEISVTENISTGGFATVLWMELKVGEHVTSICPYMKDGQNIEQVAECRWGMSANQGKAKKKYGMQLLESGPPSVKD